MKCPTCVDEGLKSQVTPTGTYTTLMAFNRYYDEDGTWHSHDPNEHTTRYHCSVGHSWEWARLAACGSCDYGKATA